MRRALLSVLIALPTNAGAQTPLVLTLDDAVSRGLAASHRLAEEEARGDAAGARAEAQRASRMPQLTAQAGYTRTNHVEPFSVVMPNRQIVVIYPDVPDNYRTRLDLQWPIYTFGRLDALERAARAEASASTDDLVAARADLKLEISRAYWALVTAIESERVVNESVSQLGAHLRDVRNQFGAGLVPPNDVSSVEAQESRQRMLSVQARAAHDIAEADLARLIDAPLDAVIRPAPSLTPPAPDLTPVAGLVEEARAARAERAALVKRMSAVRERLLAAEATGRPAVTFNGGIDYARPNPRIFPRQPAWLESWDASVNLSWPVLDGGRARADVAEAAAGVRAAEQRLAEFDSTLAVEVRQRARELEADLAAIAAGDAAVRSAGEARRALGDRFAAGVATSTDVLDAQVALLQAELDRTQAVASARLAEARLARALGR
jgi:outer membrane protein TolC